MMIRVFIVFLYCPYLYTVLISHLFPYPLLPPLMKALKLNLVSVFSGEDQYETTISLKTLYF